MLCEITDDVHVWLGEGRLDSPNAGVVVDDDGLTVVDALLHPAQAAAFAASLDRFGCPVRRLVLTSSHVPFAGGSAVFKLAGVYGSAATSANLDLPPNVAGYQHLFPAHASQFVDLATRKVSHVVQQAAWLSQKVIAAPLPGHQSPNLVVQVPHANVVFAGALCAFGAHPLGFEADIDAWIDSLDQLSQWGEVVVPGVGPVGGAEELAELRAYLAAVRDAATRSGDAAALAAGPWNTWADAAFAEVNVERAALLSRSDTSPPPSALHLFGFA